MTAAVRAARGPAGGTYNAGGMKTRPSAAPGDTSSPRSERRCIHVNLSAGAEAGVEIGHRLVHGHALLRHRVPLPDRDGVVL